MSDALPVPLESLTPRERRKLRPVLERIAWERHVEAQYRELLDQGLRSDRAIEYLAIEESRRRQGSISARTIERIVWPKKPKPEQG